MTTSSRFHGILRISEELLLEALEINDSEVGILGVKKKFGELGIKIHLTSSEQEINVGNGNINLYPIREGEVIPYVSVMHNEK